MANAKKDAKGGKDGKPPIIKKIKKVQGGGHHGGAWKVAYADFVTAMMAFFLLLWLLSTSSKATLDGIAEFFTPTVGITGQTGSIKFVKKDGDPLTIMPGAPPPGQVSAPQDTTAPVEDQEDMMFKEGGTQVEQAFQKDPEMQKYIDNISVQVTPEGLKIDLIDSDKYPMFAPGSATLSEHGEKILARMTTVIKRMPNYMSLTGHTDGSPAEAGSTTYTNWELSADRANAARRFLVKSGMEQERPKKVTGMGDKELLLPSEPRSPRNRRISIVMLRGSHILIPDADANKAPDLMSAPPSSN